MPGNETYAHCYLGTRRSGVCGFPDPSLPPGADSLAALGKYFISVLPFQPLEVRTLKLHTSNQGDFAPFEDILKDNED